MCLVVFEELSLMMRVLPPVAAEVPRRVSVCADSMFRGVELLECRCAGGVGV